MATDPKPSVAPASSSEPLSAELHQALASGVGEFSLRELLSWLLSSVGLAERQAYLERIQHDKPNGFYDRSLQLGTVPVEVRVPRTRRGDFRPASLPAPYQRGYSEEVQTLLLGLRASSRSLNAAKDALQKMGLSNSQQDLDRVATGLIEELELRNSRSLDPDLLALFLDGKYVEFRDGDRLRPACIYVIVGLRRDGRKQVLTCLARPGRENLEDWKAVLRGLLERGLRRVLLLVQDKACFPTPMYSSAPCTCSAMPKLISTNLTPSSFNSAGEPSRPPGISRPRISNSKNSVIVSSKPTRLLSASCARSASTTWPSSPTRNRSAALSPPPTLWKLSTASSKSCAATAVATSIAKTS